MRCESCDSDIPPAWVAALKSGICPGCGENIYTDETKQLMEELATAMISMPNNPQGLAGWLISNYRLQKIGDAKPVEKFNDKSSKRPEIDERTLKIPKNSVDTLLSRTDAFKSVQDNKARAMAAGKGNQNKLAQMAANIASIYEDDQISEREDIESNEIKLDEYGEEVVQEERGPRLSRNLLNNSGLLLDPNAPPLTAKDIKALAQAISPNESESDYMHEQRLKRVHAQNQVLGGGAIRRSS